MMNTAQKMTRIERTHWKERAIRARIALREMGCNYLIHLNQKFGYDVNDIRLQVRLRHIAHGRACDPLVTERLEALVAEQRMILKQTHAAA